MSGGNSIHNNDTLGKIKIEYVPERLKWDPLVPNAEKPLKNYDDECGFRLTLLDRTENRTEDVYNDINFYTAEIAFEVPHGHYLEITGTDELLKSGYAMLQNKIYNPHQSHETLIVGLYKFVDKEDLELPVDYVYAIPRKTDFMFLTRVQNDYEQVSHNSQRYSSGGGRSGNFAGQSIQTTSGRESRRAQRQSNNRQKSHFM